MKRIFSLFLLCVLLVAALVSCADKTKEPVSLSAEPLLRLALPDGKGRDMRAWYLPQSNGFLYLHPTETGFSGGFVSPLRSVSSEAIIDAKGDPEEVIVWETASDRAAIATPDFVALTLLKEGSSQISAMPEKFGVEEVYPFDGLSFLAKSKHLLLKIPVNLENAFVLADTDLLSDYAAPIAVADAGKRIYYATGEKEAYTGTAFFEYGKHLPLGKEDFSFSSVQSLPGGAFLLQKDKTAFRYVDPTSDRRRDLVLESAVTAFAASPSGSLFCALEKADNGDLFSFYDMASGTKIATLPLPGATAASSFVLSERTRFFGVSAGDELLLYTADLSEII